MVTHKKTFVFQTVKCNSYLKKMEVQIKSNYVVATKGTEAMLDHLTIAVVPPHDQVLAFCKLSQNHP